MGCEAGFIPIVLEVLAKGIREENEIIDKNVRGPEDGIRKGQYEIGMEVLILGIR